MPAPRKALTKLAVEGAKPGDKWGRCIWDGRVPGFGCRLFPPTKPGEPPRRVYIFRYRTRSGQKQRVVALGKHGALTVEQAREMALDLYEQVRRGGDPAQELKRAAAAEDAAPALTFASLLE